MVDGQEVEESLILSTSWDPEDYYERFYLKSMPPDVNHLAVIIESAVLPESVRTHEAETKVALDILAHKGGCDTAACPYVFMQQATASMTGNW